eukprot:9298948-Pyramimonas_sp.AAC.1
MGHGPNSKGQERGAGQHRGGQGQRLCEGIRPLMKHKEGPPEAKYKANQVPPGGWLTGSHDDLALEPIDPEDDAIAPITIPDPRHIIHPEYAISLAGLLVHYWPHHPKPSPHPSYWAIKTIRA